MSLTIQREYWRKSRSRFWFGRQVRALVDHPTGGRVVIPAGNVLRVTGKNASGLLNLQAHSCKCCGSAIQVTGIPYGKLAFVEGPHP